MRFFQKGIFCSAFCLLLAASCADLIGLDAGKELPMCTGILDGGTVDPCVECMSEAPWCKECEPSGCTPLAPSLCLGNWEPDSCDPFDIQNWQLSETYPRAKQDVCVSQLPVGTPPEVGPPGFFLFCPKGTGACHPFSIQDCPAP